jgi:hypothetical protein
MWGLLAAGLGILANNYGNYGNASPALGKGGLIGLETFLGQRQLAEKNKFAQQELDQRQQLQNAQIGNYQSEVDKRRQEILEMQDARKAQAALDTAYADFINGIPEADRAKAMSDPNTHYALAGRIHALNPKAAQLAMKNAQELEKLDQGNWNPTEVTTGGKTKTTRMVNKKSGEWRDVPGALPTEVGSLVSVDASDKTETEFGKKYGGEQGNRANSIEQMADKAGSQLHQTNVMYDMAKRWKDSGGQLGAAGGAQALATGAIQAIGGDPSRLGLPKDAGPAQTLEAISNTFVLSKIGGEGGMPANNFSNADLQFLQATKPRVANTPEGFVLTLMLERGAARRAMQMDEMFQNELDAFPPDQERRAYRSFRRKWQQFVNNNSAWTPEETAEINAMKKGLGAQEGAAPSGTMRRYNPETRRIE